MSQAEIRADEGRIATRTDDMGVFKLPTSVVRENSIDVDLRRGEQAFPLRLKLTSDMLSAIQTASASPGREADRVLVVRLSGSTSIPSPDPVTGVSGRLLTEALSLPKETNRSNLRETPLLQLRLNTPLSGAVINTSLVLSGECSVGYLVRVKGDVANTSEVTCTDSGGRGTFTVNATVAYKAGLNSVTLEHVDPATGAYVSQLVVFRSTELTLNTTQIQGLVGTIEGSCNSSAGVATNLTTTVGKIVSQSCSQNVFSAVIHLPAGEATSFEVKLSSTSGGGVIDEVTKIISRSAFVCPAGYIGVPRSGVAGLGHAGASKLNTNPVLNVDRDFCIMKYPAKNVSSTAQSVKEGTPWVNIQRGANEVEAGSALKACKDLGPNYRLISNTQYQTVARNAESVAANWSGGAVGTGMIASGHADRNPRVALENGTDDKPYFGTGNTSSDAAGSGWEQRRTHLLSNGEVIWDLSGNVRNWVSDEFSTLGSAPAFTLYQIYQFSDPVGFPIAGVNAGINKLVFGPAGPFSATQNMGLLSGGSAGGVLRGGDFDGNVSPGPGLFATHLFYTYWYAYAFIGFRCSYVP